MLYEVLNHPLDYRGPLGNLELDFLENFRGLGEENVYYIWPERLNKVIEEYERKGKILPWKLIEFLENELNRRVKFRDPEALVIGIEGG